MPSTQQGHKDEARANMPVPLSIWSLKMFLAFGFLKVDKIPKETSLRSLLLPPEIPKDTCFPFLRLPAEIRNMIYELCLKHGHCEVHVRHRRGEPHARKVYCHFPDLGRERIGSMGWWRACMKLLRVSRQVHHESASVFYGCNRFWTSTTLNLHYFLRTIGSSKLYLRNLEVDDSNGYQDRKSYNRCCALSCAWQLRQTKGLQSLRINVCRFRTDQSPRGWSIAADWLPLLVMLVDERGIDTSRLLEFVDLEIGFEKDFCPTYGRLDPDQSAGNDVVSMRKALFQLEFEKKIKSVMRKIRCGSVDLEVGLAKKAVPSLTDCLVKRVKKSKKERKQKEKRKD